MLAISDCGRIYLFICVHGLPFPGKIVGLMRTKRKSTIADDAMPFDVDLCLPISSSCGGSVWQALALAGGDLVDEDDEEQQRRRANFSVRRQRHVLADNLRKYYDAILAESSDDEEQ